MNVNKNIQEIANNKWFSHASILLNTALSLVKFCTAIICLLAMTIGSMSRGTFFVLSLTFIPFAIWSMWRYPFKYCGIVLAVLEVIVSFTLPYNFVFFPSLGGEVVVDSPAMISYLGNDDLKHQPITIYGRGVLEKCIYGMGGNISSKVCAEDKLRDSSERLIEVHDEELSWKVELIPAGTVLKISRLVPTRGNDLFYPCYKPVVTTPSGIEILVSRQDLELFNKGKSPAHFVNWYGKNNIGWEDICITPSF